MDVFILNAAQSRRYCDEMISAYQAAFSQTPYPEALSDTQNFASRLPYLSARADFRCMVAPALEKD